MLPSVFAAHQSQGVALPATIEDAEIKDFDVDDDVAGEEKQGNFHSFDEKIVQLPSRYLPVSSTT